MFFWLPEKAKFYAIDIRSSEEILSPSFYEVMFTDFRAFEDASCDIICSFIASILIKKKIRQRKIIFKQRKLVLTRNVVHFEHRIYDQEMSTDMSTVELFTLHLIEHYVL